jgi:hypothetical protein
MHTDPKAADVWLCRHDDSESMSNIKREFTTAQIMATLQAKDASLHSKIKILYDRSIDYGAHPNERAVTSNLQIDDELEPKRYSNIYCHGDGHALEHALMSAARIGLGGLLIFRLIFPDRFALLNVSERIDQLRQSL